MKLQNSYRYKEEWYLECGKNIMLKKKVSDEILDHLKTRMIVESQKQKIEVRNNNIMVDVCKWSDIGTSFKQYSSPEITMKMNIITETQFNIDDKMEETIMDKCALKYIAEKDDATTKGCVARLITQNKMVIW